jgi:diguanylate cyclase (GGDEF)-like protein
MFWGGVGDQAILDLALERLELGAEALDQLAESVAPGARTGDAGLGGRVAELERLAGTDELTGLANRRRWMATVRTAIREGTPGELLLCDVDLFKTINDTHGHATGDLVLCEIARVLGRHGVAGRLGGDEFALWIPNAAGRPAEAEAIVAEVERAFAEAPALKVTVSIGVAQVASDLTETIELADGALYDAKAAGRSCARRAASRAA